MDTDIIDVENAKNICKQLLREKELSYESLDITAYTPEKLEYWEQNKQFLKVDTVSFFYPLVCIIARFGLRFCLRWKIAFNNQHINETVSDYLSNSFCFVMLSAEIFTILFIHGYVQNIVVLFVFDGIVLLGILIKALIKLS